VRAPPGGVSVGPLDPAPSVPDQQQKDGEGAGGEKNNSKNDDNNNTNNDKTDKPKYVSRFWLYMWGVVPAAGYYYERREAYNALVEELDETVVPTTPKQAKLLSKRMRLSTPEVFFVGRQLIKNAINGHVSPDTVATIVATYVHQTREARYAAYLKSSGNRDLRLPPEKAALPSELGPGSFAVDSTPDVPETDAVTEEQAKLEAEKAAAENGGDDKFEYYYEEVEEVVEDDYSPSRQEFEEQMLETKKMYQPLDCTAVLRTSALTAQMLSLPTVLTALSLLATDYDADSEQVYEAKERKKNEGTKTRTQKRWKQKFVKSLTKLNLAWQTADMDTDGFLSFEELTTLLRRMSSTGHIDSEDLIRQTKLYPPTFAQQTAEELATLYVKRTPQYIAAYKAANGDPDLALAAVGATATGPFKIAFKDFKLISLSLTRSEELKLWYLEDTSQGFFGNFKTKRGEQLHYYAQLTGNEWLKNFTEPEYVQKSAEMVVEPTSLKILTELDNLLIFKKSLRYPSAPKKRENTSILAF
jgi:hypothetical protein